MTSYLESKLFQNTEAASIIPNFWTQKCVQGKQYVSITEVKRGQKKTLITEWCTTWIIPQALSIINALWESNVGSRGI